tara:strand:+ start:859 stop:1020 length:162 start_codon:yes stop_codon:yes gene_type:complete
MKKTEQIVFRTTDENKEFLQSLADSDDRTISYIVNKMVDAFRLKRIKKASSIK